MSNPSSKPDSNLDFDPIRSLMQDSGGGRPSNKADPDYPDMPPSFEKEQTEKERRTVQTAKTLLFFCLLFVGFLVGVLMALRPAVSEAENRKLTKFPEFTLSAFLKGDYTAQITTWYADTYPLRDPMIATSHKLDSMRGFGAKASPIRPSSEIPTDMTPEELESYMQALENRETDSETGKNPEKETEPDPTGQVIENRYVVEDGSFELFYFNQEVSTQYALQIRKAASKLKGTAKVYDVVIPLRYSLYLSPELQKSLGVSDAEAAISYIYQMIGDNAVTVPLYSLFKEHKDEPLFFRTDHHWNGPGAHLACSAVLEAMGKAAIPLSSYRDSRQIEGFLGSLYNDAGKPESMSRHPDTVYAYVPNATNDITHYHDGNVYTNYGIISGVGATWNKYLTFLGGDFALSHIHNPTLTDGSSVVLVKESFGNAFAPFLVDAFEDVWVLDYRFFPMFNDQTLDEFVKEKNIENVIFLNNLIATSASARVSNLSSLIGD